MKHESASNSVSSTRSTHQTRVNGFTGSTINQLVHPHATASLSSLPDLISFPLTDSGNAERMRALYGPEIRYSHETKSWLVYDDRRWQRDSSKRVSDLAKNAARLLYLQALELPADGKLQIEYKHAIEKHARKSESAKGRRDALDCLSAEQDEIPILQAELDSDPLLLNCLNGTIDLATGTIRSHRREDFISKMIPIEYDPAARCPTFERFLHEIMGDNLDSEPNDDVEARVRYLQKMFGCAATAKPEKVLFILYGTGNNGKTTLIEIVRSALGDEEYAGSVAIESLMARPKEAASSNAVNSDLADLRGCRFVSSSEVEQGQRLSLSRVKQLTGMGKVKARRLNENWVTFPATHKIFIDANHRPVVTDPHDAVWNRIKCVPFNVEIPPDRIDTSLPERLRSELPGILRWIVEGSVLYLKEGLGDPPAIISATTETYRKESDQIAEFIDDKCIQKPNDPLCWVPVAELYPGYMAWGLANGYKDLLSKRDFDEQIKLKGCTQTRGYINSARGKTQARIWLGIRFRTDDDPGQNEPDKSRADN